MFCSQCGTANADGAQFCSKCGAALSNAPASTNPALAVPGAAQPAIYPPQSSGKALASLIFGLFFFVFPAAVVAIVFGHLSLSEIRKSAGRLTGRGMAMAGLILGYIGVAMIPFVLIVAAIAIPNLLRSKIAANQASAVGSLRTIISANLTYSSQFGSGFATTLDQLDGFGGTAGCDHAMLIDHVLATGQRHGYVFTYSARPSSDAPAKGCTEPGARGFTVNADPVNRNSTGMQSYFTDETGVIRVEKSGPASADSDELQ
jgi:type IV pilus assembly protein PilA